MRMSLAEYEALPEVKPYLEYWDGLVLQKAVPKRKHGKLEFEVTRRLCEYGHPIGGDAWPEAHVWFEGHGWLVPDVAYWAPGKPQGDDDRSLPPTLAVEIRSPDESRAAQREKCRRMRANGVDVCWLIDPESRTVELFDADHDGEPFGPGATVTSAALPGLELRVDELFAVLDA
jgi:Uma2 family endonuclease